MDQEFSSLCDSDDSIEIIPTTIITAVTTSDDDDDDDDDTPPSGPQVDPKKPFEPVKVPEKTLEALRRLSKKGRLEVLRSVFTEFRTKIESDMRAFMEKESKRMKEEIFGDLLEPLRSFNQPLESSPHRDENFKIAGDQSLSSAPYSMVEEKGDEKNEEKDREEDEEIVEEKKGEKDEEKEEENEKEILMMIVEEKEEEMTEEKEEEEKNIERSDESDEEKEEGIVEKDKEKDGEEEVTDEENGEIESKNAKFDEKPSNINNNAVNGDTILNESQHSSPPSTPTSTSSSMVMMMSSSSITPNSLDNSKITNVYGISNNNPSSSPSSMQFSTPSSNIGSSELATSKSGPLPMIPDDLQHSAFVNENVIVGPEEDLISRAYLIKNPVQCPKCLRIFRGKTPAVAYNNHRRNRHCPFSSETKRLSLKNRPSTGGSSGSTLKTLTNDSKASSSVNDSLKLVSTLSSSSSSASHKNGSSKHISTAVNSSSTNKSKKIDPSNPNWGRDSVRYFCKICNSNDPMNLQSSRVSLTIHLTVSHGIPPVNMNPDLCLPLNLRCQSCSKIFNSKYIYFLHRFKCDLDSPYVGIHHLPTKKRGRKSKPRN